MIDFLKKHISKENEEQQTTKKEDKYILLQDFDLLNALLEQEYRCVQMIITNSDTKKYQYEIIDYK